MTAPATEPSEGGTTSSDYGSRYYAGHLGDADYSWNNESWREFFLQVAQRVRAITGARKVADVGCAKGLFVQALAELGVDATGFDISDHAVESAHPDVRDRLRVASATEPLKERYDLVSCIEVLEHMSPREADLAIDVLCAASDLVLFSSSPHDYGEPTHVNVRPPADWVAAFAERGFFRRTDVNLDFLTPWAILFQKADLTTRDVVHRYESTLDTLHTEVLEKRTALLEAHREIGRLSAEEEPPTSKEQRLALQGRLDEQLRRVDELEQALLAERHDRLTTRDHVIGLEARAEELTRKLKVHQVKLNKRVALVEELRGKLAAERQRAQAARRELEEMQGSRSWRWGRALTRPFRLLRG
jgi:SAM-dependent methyltransferase